VYAGARVGVSVGGIVGVRVGGGRGVNVRVGVGDAALSMRTLPGGGESPK
jgi:hypothetical protein